MAENDIYNNKKRYDNFIKNISNLINKSTKYKYYCINKNNLKYFNKLISSFEIDDLSYIRRLRMLNILKFLTYFIKTDLKTISKTTKDDLIIEIRKKFKITNIKKTERDIKRIYKILFGKLPKPLEDFNIRIDKSMQKNGNGKLTYEEFDKLMKYFSNNITFQAYLSLAFESLGRPQEILFTKISDLELFDNYAIVNVSEHGKEGTKKLISIDSYPYLIKMYNSHKDRKNNDSFLFLNGNNKQLTPYAINKRLKKACKYLNIDKHITCYSLKRFGVTFRRLNGDNDVTIQRIAGWTSTRQLQTYDLSNQDDVFKIELAKRGLIKDVTLKEHYPKTKTCEYCGERVGFSESSCPKCYNLMDKDMIKKRIEAREKPHEFLNQIMDDEVIELLLRKAKEKGVEIK